MKKILLLAFVFLLVAGLSACGGQKTPPAPAQQDLDAMQQALAAMNPADAASVLRAHFAARNAFDTAAAMTTVADSAVFVSQKDTATGAQQVQDFIQKRANQGFQFTLSDIQVDGDQLTFSAVVSVAGKEAAQLTGKASLVDGKITNLETTEK